MDKDNELIVRKALFYTNMAYVLVDMANSAIIDTENQLVKIGRCIKDEQKKKFAYAKNQIKKSR